MADPKHAEAAFREKMVRDGELNEFIRQRVYPVLVPPSGEYPCAVYRRAGTQRRNHMRGASGAIGANLELRLWSKDYDEAKAMFDAFRRDLDGYQNLSWTVGPTTYRLKSISIVEPGEHDDADEDPYAGGEPIYCVVVPLRIEHTETTVSHV